MRSTDDDGVVVARIEGDIDFGSAGDLGRDVLRDLPDAAVGLVLDLTDVRYVDSGGVRVFFELAAQLDMSGRRVALAVPETSPRPPADQDHPARGGRPPLHDRTRSARR